MSTNETQQQNAAPELENHPIAGIFPMMEPEALAELAESISANGQRHDIVLLDGKILDGRNRFAACTLSGVTPAIREFDPAKDGSVIDFVLDENLNRRHLSASQRAMIAAQSIRLMQQRAEKEAARKLPAQPETEADGTIMEPDDEEEEEEGTEIAHSTSNVVPTQEEAATSAGVSRRSLQTAESVLKNDAETGSTDAETVVSGEKSLSQVDQGKREAAEVEERRTKRAEILKQVTKTSGAEFAQAITDNAVLKTASELRGFLALDDETQSKVAPLIAQGWKVTRAASHVLNEISESSTIQDLLNRCISEKGFLSIKINGHEITVSKLS